MAGGPSVEEKYGRLCNAMAWCGVAWRSVSLARKLKLIKDKMRGLGLPPRSGTDLRASGTSRGVGWCTDGVALEDATGSLCQTVGSQPPTYPPVAPNYWNLIEH